MSLSRQTAAPGEPRPRQRVLSQAAASEVVRVLSLLGAEDLEGFRHRAAERGFINVEFTALDARLRLDAELKLTVLAGSLDERARLLLVKAQAHLAQIAAEEKLLVLLLGPRSRPSALAQPTTEGR